MKAYSVDLRSRVLDALERGMSRDEVLVTFQISRASLKRWLKARRETGDLRPLPASGGRDLTIPPAQEALLRAQVAAMPDATLAEHTAQWNASQGVTLSPSTLRRAITRLGLTRKKRA